VPTDTGTASVWASAKAASNLGDAFGELAPEMSRLTDGSLGGQGDSREHGAAADSVPEPLTGRKIPERHGG